MRQSVFWFSIGILLCLRNEPSSVVGSQSHRQRDGRVVTSSELSHLDSDFENGKLDPWIEESTKSGVQWKIENKISPWDLNNKAPPQLNGTSYLRLYRETNLKFGVAVLRSPAFSLPFSENDISLSFSFWIRSKWPQFTNLELYLAENGNERLTLSLYNYSAVTNQAWEGQSISLLIDHPSSTFSLVFYAYCGIDPEDAVAIDDIRFISNQFAGTETNPTFNPTVSTEVTDPADISGSTGPTTLSSMTISSSSTITDPEPATETTTIPTTSTTTSKLTITTISNSQPTTTESTTTPTTSTTTLVPTTTTITSTNTTTTTTQVQTTTISTSFTCPDTTEKKYPVPENPCNGKYYLCSGGIATLTDCQESLIFNSIAQLCTPCSLVLTCIDECPE